MGAPAKIPLKIDEAGKEVFRPKSADPTQEFALWLGRILGTLMTIALLILLFYLIWGAFEWMTSAGDNTKLQAARNRMLHAVVGILILSGTLALFMLVQYFLNVEIISFS